MFLIHKKWLIRTIQSVIGLNWLYAFSFVEKKKGLIRLIQSGIGLHWLQVKLKCQIDSPSLVILIHNFRGGKKKLQYLNWFYIDAYKINVLVKLKQDWWSGLPLRCNLLPSGWGLRLTPNICRRSGSRKRKGMLETCNRLGCCFSEESEGWSCSCWEPSVCATSSACWKTHKHSSVSS